MRLTHHGNSALPARMHVSGHDQLPSKFPTGPAYSELYVCEVANAIATNLSARTKGGFQSLPHVSSDFACYGIIPSMMDNEVANWNLCLPGCGSRVAAACITRSSRGAMINACRLELTRELA